jgi:hypothetical protein
MLAGIDKGLSLRAADRPQSIAEWRAILWQTGKFGAAPAEASDGLSANDDRVEPARPEVRVPPLRRASPPPDASPPNIPPVPPHGASPVDVRPQYARPVDTKSVDARSAEAGAADARPVEMPHRQVPPRDAPPPDMAFPDRRSGAATLRMAPDQEPPPQPAADAFRTAGPTDEPALPTAPRRGRALWVALASASALVLGAATYFLFAIPSSEPTQATASAVDSHAEALARQHAQMAEATARAQAEAARQQAAAAAQQRAEAAKEAARQQAAEDARRKAEAEAEAKRRAEAADPKRAHAAETALKLSYMDRMHAQVALAALGFDPKGTDGVFGSRSRKAIAAWQQSRNDPPTGYLTATQRQALMKDGAAAIEKFDARRKGGDAAEDDSSGGKANGSGPFDGKYVGTVNVSTGDQPVSTRISNGKGSGSWKVEGCGKATYSLSIAPDGTAALDLRSYSLQCEPIGRHYDSQMESNSLLFTFKTEGDPAGGLTLTRQQP